MSALIDALRQRLPAERVITDELRRLAYGTDEALVSYCRKPNGPGGDWSPDCPPTMGTAN